MNWMRHIKRTAVRRVVWIVVGLLVYALLSLLGVGVAHAQTASYCGFEGIQGASNSRNNSPYEFELDALGACESMPAEVWWNSSYGAQHATRGACEPVRNSKSFTTTYIGTGRISSSCEVNGASIGSPSNPWFTYQNSGCPPGTTWNEEQRQCLAPCQGLSPLEGNVNTSLQPIVPTYCVSGCSYNASNPLCTMVEEGPTAGYWCNVMYNPTGGQCTAGPEDIPNDPNAPEECAIDEVRLANGDCSPRGDCPIGQHKVNNECHPIGRCPTGFVKSPDGSCSPKPCPSGQARGQDGTCKADTNQDGVPDEEGPDGDGTNKDGMEFSGGDSCAYPPTCSGDAIMCGQARIQWRIDCNTRRERYVEGGNHCDVFNAPICIGEDCDPVEHKQLTYAWKAACALEALVDRNSEGDGDSDGGGDLGGVEDRLDRIGDFLDGGGNCLSTEAGCEPSEVPWDDEEPQHESWSSGLSSTGSCPAPISTTITFMGHSAPIEFSYQPICDFAALMRWVLITAATILSGLIVAGLRTSPGGT